MQKKSPKVTSRITTPSSRVQSLKSTVTQYRVSAVMALVSVGICLVAGLMWYHYYFTKPSVVLWGALDRALNVPGIAKRVTRSGEGTTRNILSVIRFEGEPTIATQTEMIEDNSEKPDEKITVVAESLGTLNGEYQRYTKTPTSGASDEQIKLFAGIKDKWVQTSEKTGKPGQLFMDSLLGTVPFGNLSNTARKNMIAVAKGSSEKNKSIFSVDFDAVERQAMAGRNVYVYELKPQPMEYARWYQQYLEAIGLGQYSDPRYTEAISNALGLSEQTRFRLSVDMFTRQIIKIQRLEAGELTDFTESVFAYGATPAMSAPLESISREEFQKLITPSGESQ